MDVGQRVGNWLNNRQPRRRRGRVNKRSGLRLAGRQRELRGYVPICGSRLYDSNRRFSLTHRKIVVSQGLLDASSTYDVIKDYTSSARPGLARTSGSPPAYRVSLFRMSEPVAAPPFADSCAFKLNFALFAQPVKSMVTGCTAFPPGAIFANGVPTPLITCG